MSVLDREETLRRLKAMETQLQTIDRLRKQKDALEKTKNQVAVNQKNYDTGHAERVRAEREQVRTETLGKLKKRNPWGILALLLGIALGVILFLFVSMLYSLIPVAVGIILCCTAGALAKRKYQADYEAAVAQIDATYAPRLEAAENADWQANADYQKAVKDAKAQKLSEVTPKLAELSEQLREHEEQLEAVRVLDDRDLAEDPELIGKMIRMITSYRADSIKECFQLLDAEKERQRQEAQERYEREQARRREEEERKRHSPGEVYVYVGEKHSYGYKPPRNTIIIDGQEYGPGGIPYKKITLQPGWHTISVMVQLYYGGDYHFPQSDTLQFELEGGGKKYFQFYLKDSPVVYGFERSSESALHQDP